MTETYAGLKVRDDRKEDTQKETRLGVEGEDDS